MNASDDSLSSRQPYSDIITSPPLATPPAPPPPVDAQVDTTPPPVEADAVEAMEDTAPVAVPTVTSNEATEEVSLSLDEVSFSNETIDFRGENPEELLERLREREASIGGAVLVTKLRTIGSWENLVLRALQEDYAEEERLREVLGELSPTDRQALSHQLLDPTTNKPLLKTSSLYEPIAGDDKQTLSGDAAFMAFACHKVGGGYRIPLYNSGITLDVIVPVGNDIQTMLNNCTAMDEQLGSSLGAHYFVYNDLVYKNQILNFVYPLIVNSSYSDWRKRDKLFSIMKLPDLVPLVATIAAMCHRDGFDGFVTKCSRPKSEDHPEGCQHTENLNVNIFNMILTRFQIMSKDAIDYMVDLRMNSGKRNLAAVAKYQADLGFEGERIVADNITFVMKIPTIAEHGDDGRRFISDIINEVEGDNTNGYYEQFGLRYIRTFVPWISSIETTVQTSEGPKVITTSEPKTIIHQLERIDGGDRGELRKLFLGYIAKTQLTYFGYPVLPCDKCGYKGDTPSGLWTVDPFNAFFTLVSQSLMQS
jgi:hypothetical protein